MWIFKRRKEETIDTRYNKLLIKIDILEKKIKYLESRISALEKKIQKLFEVS